MTRSLDGKVAIVTGAARGIGLGIAQKLKADGARVAVWDLNVDDCGAQRLGFAPDHVQQVDVASMNSVEQAFAATLDHLGQVDILVNNAGINGPVAPCWEYPVDAWQRVIAVDLNSVFYCCRVAIPHMRARGGGRIVNVASIAGKEGVQFISGYSAAKAGVIAFTKAAAKELAKDNVLINCVAPAMVETELFSEMSDAHIEASKAKIPMGRFLQIEEVGAMVSWIASPECSFTSGFTFDLTGGRATY
ncbi:MULTISPECIES: SDR family NAD(P)-dependent oxidoreductase [Paraburkholderia]|jgi:NAD(P)-dependent dehydrogenase (short-subunit alcohol dehydrogenase family)|uniref:SDR family NAD(P)-dependent oxidoreductase n=1 Tax=Paraburkholderia dipogonis TaxID=1211383 RepID=A0ABW9ASN2_9BURK|nr:SDR family NAD(P)-dependent oxidoreductase [Paraburkholderia sp. BL9I2N2]TCK86920.1 3-oxoacyl-[acyl-carrier protein] reductase [Paraburkholderia sp. BL9I2N2]